MSHEQVRSDARAGTAFRDSLQAFAGALAGTVLGFLTNLLIMRSLGPEGFGVVAVALTIQQALWQLSGRGLDQAAVRRAAETGDAAGPAAARVFGSSLGLKLAVGGAACLAGVAASGVLTSLLLGPQVGAGAVAAGAAASLAASLWGHYAACAQASRRFDRYAAQQVFAPAARLVATACLAAWGWLTPTTAMLAMLAGFALGAAGGWLGASAAGRSVSGDAAERGRLAVGARWLVISSVIHLLYSRLDHLLLAALRGAGAVGVYGAAAQFVQIVDLLTGSLLSVMLPRLCAARDAASLRRAAAACLRTSALLAAPMLLAFPLAGPVVRVVLGEAFGTCVPLIWWILPGAIVNLVTHPLQGVLHRCGRTQWLTAIDAVALPVSAVAVATGIALGDSTGAAVANLCVRLLGSAALSILVGAALFRRDGGGDRACG